MAAENALAFLRGIAQGRLDASSILIAGPQAFLREYVLEATRALLARDGFKFRAFQVGAGDSFSPVVNELNGGDLFAPKRLIACRVLRSYRERGSADEDGDESASAGARGGDAPLLAALERLSSGTRFVLLYEKDNAPAKVRRAFEKTGATVNCMRPFDNQIGHYAEIFARYLGLKLSMQAGDLLIGRHGGDLAAIANAIAKAGITADADGKVGTSNLSEPGAGRVPDLFELAESVARGNPAETLALFDRAVQTGRDPIELLALEIIPLLRRMLIAAAVLARRKSNADAAAAMGLPPQSTLAARAIDGARKFGVARLSQAHRRACELDANFKVGLLKEREQAIGGMILELMAGG